MSYLDFAKTVSLFSSLHAIDVELSNRSRAAGCSHCGGPLHSGSYERKPRGVNIDIPDTYMTRYSLCCGRCRRRTLPESVLFFGRKVFWGVVVILVTGVVQGLEGATIKALCERFSVSRRTVKRWLSFFVFVFPRSGGWKWVRGLVSPHVDNGKLPCSVLAWFRAHKGATMESLVACLKLLLCPRSVASRGTARDAQKMPT